MDNKRTLYITKCLACSKTVGSFEHVPMLYCCSDMKLESTQVTYSDYSEDLSLSIRSCKDCNKPKLKLEVNVKHELVYYCDYCTGDLAGGEYYYINELYDKSQDNPPSATREYKTVIIFNE